MTLAPGSRSLSQEKSINPQKPEGWKCVCREVSKPLLLSSREIQIKLTFYQEAHHKQPFYIMNAFFHPFQTRQ